MFNFVKKTILWYFEYIKIIKTYLQNNPNKTSKTTPTKQNIQNLTCTNKKKLNEKNKNNDLK